MKANAFGTTLRKLLAHTTGFSEENDVRLEENFRYVLEKE